MTKSTLRPRIQHLEDVKSIKTLTARYADAVNKGWNATTLDLNAIPELFTAGARFTDHQLVTTVGAAAIAAELPRATAMVDFSTHAFLNPLIDLDGDSATGSWLLWIASVLDHQPAAVYLSADLSYLRTATGWRIDSVQVHDGIRIPARRTATLNQLRRHAARARNRLSLGTPSPGGWRAWPRTGRGPDHW